MAFKGGFLVKPTTTSTDALAALYLNAVKDISEKKREIQKEELGLLKEATATTNVPTSGVSTLDGIIGQYGINQRKSMQDLYDARQQGKISTDEYTLAMINQKSETELFSQYPTFIAKENAEIQKGIESGDLSGVNSELYIGRFRDLNGGNPEAKNQIYNTFHQNGQGFIRLDYTVDGEPKNKTISINQMMDPNKRRIKKFDLQQYTKDFTEILGEKQFIDFSTQKTKAGTAIIETIDESKQPDIVDAINRNVSKLSNDALIDILYDHVGVRGDYFSDYKKPTNEEVKERFGYRRDRFSIDKNERGIDISADDLTFKIEENEIDLTPKQRDIARGLVRAELYSTLGIKKTADIVETDIDTGFVDAQMRPSAGVYAKSLYKNATDELESVGNILGKGKIKESEIKEQYEVLQDNEVTTVSMNVRPAHSKRILEAIEIKSASGAKMKSVDNITVLKVPIKEKAQEGVVGAQTVGYEYKILVSGAADLGKALDQLKDEVQQGTKEGNMVTKVERILSSNQSTSEFFSENLAQDLYLTMYESDSEFRRVADDVLKLGDKGDPGMENEFYSSRYAKGVDRIFQYLKRR